MENILDIKQINPMAVVITVGKDMKNTRKLVICSDYKFETKKTNISEREIIVTIPSDISGIKNPRNVIKINAPIGCDQVNFNTHAIDERNLKIMIEN